MYGILNCKFYHLTIICKSLYILHCYMIIWKPPFFIYTWLYIGRCEITMTNFIASKFRVWILDICIKTGCAHKSTVWKLFMCAWWVIQYQASSVAFILFLPVAMCSRCCVPSCGIYWQRRTKKGGKQWQTTPKNVPRMQCARAIPVTWLGSGFCQARPSRLNTNEWILTKLSRV